MICRSEEQPPAAQFGEYVARVAPAAPAPYKYPAIAAVSDDEAHAIMDWAAASPTTPFAPSAAERRSGVSILRLKMGSGINGLLLLPIETRRQVRSPADRGR